MRHVDEEVEVTKEVGSQDWSLNVCDNKNSAEGTSKTEFQSEGTVAICRNGGAIDCLQGQVLIVYLA